MTAYDKNAALFKALSDPGRLEIVDMLSCGELCACKILERFRITQPTLSHHMKILCGCGLVQGRKSGRWVYYSLNADAAQTFHAYVGALFAEKPDCICKT